MRAAKALCLVACIACALCQAALAQRYPLAGEDFCPKGQIAEKYDYLKDKQDCLPCLASTYNHIDNEKEVTRGGLFIDPYEACYACPPGTYNHGGRVTGATSIDQCLAWPVFSTGQTIALRVNNGAYLGVMSGNSNEKKLRAKVGFVGLLERLVVEVHDDGKTIAIKAVGLKSPRRYITAFPDGRLEVNHARKAGIWEKFTPELDADGTLVLRTAHDTLIQTPDGGGTDQPLRAVNLKSTKNFFGGTVPVPEVKGSWERMRLVYVEGLVNNQVIALQTIKGGSGGPYVGIKSNPHDPNTRAEMQASSASSASVSALNRTGLIGCPHPSTEYQRFQVVTTNQSTIKLRSLGFRDAVNRFLTARPGSDGGLFVTTASDSDPATEFTVENIFGNGRVAFKSKLNGRYVQAVNGGGSDARCTGAKPDSWEQFMVESDWFVKRYTVRDV